MNKVIFNCISSELSHAGEATVVSPALLQLDKSRITLSRELPAIDFLYRMYGIPCFPRGELCIIGGKAKSGKTLYSTMLMAAGITPRGDGENALHPQLRRHRDEPLHVLWYDTEQSE
ncbi:MAG: AAA family ATPase, partial [Prevotella sp.]|nr:AAA family ATPase [Prevotella sp.]